MNASSPPPQTLHPPPDADAEQALQQWHQQRLQALQAPDGWLTLAGLVWLEDGTHSVGSGPDCAIQLPGAGRCPALWGSLRVAGTQAWWTGTDGPETPLLTSNMQPTVVKHGPISFLLLERNEALAMRIKDEQAETRTGFQGTELFAFDPALQIEAHWDGSAAHCDIGGRRYSLRPLNPQANPLHFVIGDTTSGTLSYGGGRFLYVPLATSEPGPIMLDLNRAINPPCAFTAFALCPVPPPENRLDVAVLAGEKTYGGHH